MGFETQNTNNSKPITYLSIVTEKEKDTEKTIGKFFRATKKVGDKYESTILKNSYNYPLPFFGYITDVEFKLDNTFKQSDGKIIPSPKILIKFSDDQNDIYVLDLPFTNDKGRVSGNVVTLFNSLASIDKYGLLKVYITSTDAKDKVTGALTGAKNYTINVRNDVNWNPDNADYKRFLATEDKTKDFTKVSWKYKFDEIPTLEVTKVVDGEKLQINNTKKHQQWFIDLITNEILPVIKAAIYPKKIATTASVDSNTTTTNYIPDTTYETDIPEDDEVPAVSTPASKLSNVPTTDSVDDLPF